MDGDAHAAGRGGDAAAGSDSSPGAQGERWSYFGWAERPYFQAMRVFRYGLFRPLLGGLARRGLRPNHITGASFLVILLGFPLFFGARQYGLAFAALALHLLLDGFDGPLAQLLGTQGRAQGALMDMSNDVTGMVIVVLTAAYFPESAAGVPTFIGAVYVVTYLYVTIFAVAQNLLNIHYAYVVKTKYAIYVLLFAKWLTGLELVTPIMVLASVYMGVSAFFGFMRVARTLR
ncbi:MAG: hypothetical protein M5R36_25705 [Deltaproteobacteria bacterium]|nr:hypothetical protein [Deltaproteobacteria bacterium]